SASEPGVSSLLWGVAGDYRYARVAGKLFGHRLVPHRPHGVRGGPNPGQTGVDTALCKAGVLRQEAIAGMNGVGAGLARSIEDGRDVQIARLGGCRSDEKGPIGLLDVKGVLIRLGIDSNRFFPRLVAGPRDADRDLAAICDE